MKNLTGKKKVPGICSTVLDWAVWEKNWRSQVFWNRRRRFQERMAALPGHAFIQSGLSGANRASLSQTLNYNPKTVCFAFWASGVSGSRALQPLLTSSSISARDLIVMPIKLTRCIWNQKQGEEEGEEDEGEEEEEEKKSTQETWRLGSWLSKHA